MTRDEFMRNVDFLIQQKMERIAFETASQGLLEHDLQPIDLGLQGMNEFVTEVVRIATTEKVEELFYKQIWASITMVEENRRWLRRAAPQQFGSEYRLTRRQG